MLNITATFAPAGGTPVPKVSMIVTCLVNKPADFVGKEGVTVVGGVGNCTDIIRGAAGLWDLDFGSGAEVGERDLGKALLSG